VKIYKVEYSVGNVNMVPSNILVKDIDDMEELEFWEERLRYLKQDFTVTYRKMKGKILYSIFTTMRLKETLFR